MKKLMGIGYTTSAFNIALFILRVGGGILMVHHGYDKLIHFQNYSEHFVQFLGLNSSITLSLVIFAEFFCSIFLIMGLFTRLAAIPLVIDGAMIVAKGHDMDILGKGEHGALFFLIFLTVLILGPGKISIDGMINK
jgi:putative oxidoreductase